MTKRLFGESFFDRTKLVPVLFDHCADCGTLLYNSREGLMDRFFFMHHTQVVMSTVMEVFITSMPAKPVLRAFWAREHLTPVTAKMLYRGWDELGNPRHFCRECVNKVIECECTRCHEKFTRTRDLPGGWACERCFVIHCSAMCHITPGERVAGLVWNDQQANQHYEHELVVAEDDLISKGILAVVSGGAS